ncbi:MAG TPA: AtpZ/AtpI family protein [Thermoanaerobaculia bacterium]|nr:AtpZ/AtpI family protein [Thermoanaerobaculia bacterium]
MAAGPKSGWQALSGIGFELVAAVVGFTLIGYWWDRHFGSSPWGLLAGAVLGMIGGMYNLIRRSQAAFKETGSTAEKPGGDPER